MTDYDVGYRKPPKSSQFQKGRSGNPKGRPKGTLNLATAFNRALSEKIEVVENGRKRKMTKLEVAVTAMVNRAVKGDAKAMQQMLVLSPLVGLESAPAGQLPETDAMVLKGLLESLHAGELP
ncbi:DUF5681 domain-containing protein [Thermomonas carbonis]|uniref:DUF5681 domain-containing protein n=1 Tax=Thermomonas carbonis TaxID=1463158 RepID=A0A7G9SLP6_9GAMM|nr:DUF5681 domain-containing protein [Thermomonas carbonis]QNN68771.1 hypothetical protein H9L16_08410 [Thermomonas carbonis]GHC08897.1 hypothetical protein GCM10010080_24950 [Thermomonas carbonis]